jgi:hypothetical protein
MSRERLLINGVVLSGQLGCGSEFHFGRRECLNQQSWTHL